MFIENGEVHILCFTPCEFESAYYPVSVHSTFEGATEAKEIHKLNKIAEFANLCKSIRLNEIPDLRSIGLEDTDYLIEKFTIEEN